MEKEIQAAIKLLKKNGYEIRSPKQVEELKKWRIYSDQQVKELDEAKTSEEIDAYHKKYETYTFEEFLRTSS
jgi:hypothetical protein